MVSGSEGERGRGGKERGRAGSIFEIGMTEGIVRDACLDPLMPHASCHNNRESGFFGIS